MHISLRRRALLKSLSVLAFTPHAGIVAADDWPNRPITLIVPFPAGGVTDIMARELAPRLAKSLGVSVVVDNRGGANGAIAAAAVARAKPDGYTIMFSSVGIFASNPHIYEKIPYNAQTDFTPIARLAAIDNIFVVAPSLPIRTIQDAIAYSKTKPGGLSFGSAGTGSSLHLAGELLKSMADIRFTHVPYKGSAPAEADLMGGHLDMLVTSVAAAAPNIEAGRMRAIAATRLKRSAMMPNLPTVAESGVPGFNVDSWQALHGPAGLPQPIVARLDSAVKGAMASPDFVARMRQLSLEPFYAPAGELTAYAEAESQRWGALIRKLGIRLDS